MILRLRVKNVIRTTELVILFVPSQANTYNVSWRCMLTCLAWSLYWHCCLEEMVFWKEVKVQRPLVPGLSILDSLLSCLLILPLLCHRGLHSTRGETPMQSTDWVILDNAAIWCLLVKVTQPIGVFGPILLSILQTGQKIQSFLTHNLCQSGIFLWNLITLIISKSSYIK